MAHHFRSLPLPPAQQELANGQTPGASQHLWLFKQTPLPFTAPAPGCPMETEAKFPAFSLASL